jgi:hypothetical protein
LPFLNNDNDSSSNIRNNECVMAIILGQFCLLRIDLKSDSFPRPLFIGDPTSSDNISTEFSAADFMRSISFMNGVTKIYRVDVSENICDIILKVFPDPMMESTTVILLIVIYHHLVFTILYV